jgi:hypothetical protein
MATYQDRFQVERAEYPRYESLEPARGGDSGASRWMCVHISLPGTSIRGLLGKLPVSQADVATSMVGVDQRVPASDRRKCAVTCTWAFQDQVKRRGEDVGGGRTDR